MAELGETQDPRAVVPGDPGAIAENAAVLRARARAAGEAGDGLRAIDTGAWSGPAADAMQGGAGALDDFVAALRWAQSQASEAIRLWNQGDSDQAQSVLAVARGQVESAGRIASGTLRGKASLAPEKSSWLDEAGDLLHDAGGHIVNGVASVGNAILHHPGWPPPRRPASGLPP
jgi:hypothetical protein